MEISKDIKIIIGLGNPGLEYENTYHNLGAFFVDELAKIILPEEKFKKERYFEFVKNNEVILAKPLVFMNESGLAVSSALKFFSNNENKIFPEQVLIIHDDSDLPVGGYKLDFDRSAAGHKGILSIINALGTKNFWRLRIGIRNSNEEKRIPAEDIVLKKIPLSQRKSFQSMVGLLKEKLKLKTNP